MSPIVKAGRQNNKSRSERATSISEIDPEIPVKSSKKQQNSHIFFSYSMNGITVSTCTTANIYSMDHQDQRLRYNSVNCQQVEAINQKPNAPVRCIRHSNSMNEIVGLTPW